MSILSTLPPAYGRQPALPRYGEVDHAFISKRKASMELPGEEL